MFVLINYKGQNEENKQILIKDGSLEKGKREINICMFSCIERSTLNEAVCRVRHNGISILANCFQ